MPLKPCISLQPFDLKGNCDFLRFSPRFLLHFIVQFHLLRKCGLLAHTSAAFLKNCCTEKLFVCLRLVYCNPISMLLSCHVSRETLLLGKPLESGSARLGHIPSLPRESQLPLKPCISLHPSDFEGNCDSLQFSPRFLLQFHSTVRFASQMWATRPHLGSIFEKLLHRKTFCLPAAWILQPNFYVAFMSCNVSRETLLLGKPPKSGSARLGHIPSLPWESQLPLKPCISLHPSDFEGNCDSL